MHARVLSDSTRTIAKRSRGQERVYNDAKYIPLVGLPLTDCQVNEISDWLQGGLINN